MIFNLNRGKNKNDIVMTISLSEREMQVLNELREISIKYSHDRELHDIFFDWGFSWGDDDMFFTTDPTALFPCKTDIDEYLSKL